MTRCYSCGVPLKHHEKFLCDSCLQGKPMIESERRGPQTDEERVKLLSRLVGWRLVWDVLSGNEITKQEAVLYTRYMAGVKAHLYDLDGRLMPAKEAEPEPDATTPPAEPQDVGV